MILWLRPIRGAGTASAVPPSGIVRRVARRFDGLQRRAAKRSEVSARRARHRPERRSLLQEGRQRQPDKTLERFGLPPDRDLVPALVALDETVFLKTHRPAGRDDTTGDLPRPRRPRLGDLAFSLPAPSVPFRDRGPRLRSAGAEDHHEEDPQRNLVFKCPTVDR